MLQNGQSTPCSCQSWGSGSTAWERLSNARVSSLPATLRDTHELWSVGKAGLSQILQRGAGPGPRCPPHPRFTVVHPAPCFLQKVYFQNLAQKCIFQLFSLSKEDHRTFGKEQMRFCDNTRVSIWFEYRTLNMEEAMLFFYWNINALHFVLVFIGI